VTHEPGSGLADQNFTDRDLTRERICPTLPSVDESKPHAFPAGIRHAYGFSVFNALSFQMVLAGPMVLYAKSLGASATILGLVAGMMPLLTIAQIPAAQFIPRVGYKRFVLGGWSTRVVFIFLMAVVPLTNPWLNTGSRLALIIALLFGFNVFRGLSSCAWLPWITHLIPAPLRGRFLSTDQLCANAASAAAFVFAALLLGDNSVPWRFSAVFLFSAVAGVASLQFLRRMPDVPVAPEDDGATGPVPWLRLAAHPPFRRLLEFNAVWSVAYGGLTTFIVAFLKQDAGYTERQALLVMSLSFLGGLASYFLAGRRLDLIGSKPVLGLTMATGGAAALGWGLVAGGVLPSNAAAALPLAFLVGLINALFSAANNRLAMTIVPAMGRNHFFALFAVVWQITLGLSPILWGLLLDGIGDARMQALGLDWNRYTWFFLLTALSFGAAFVMARRLQEPSAANADALLHELLIHHPRRFLVRLLNR
jgi:MFS family permease